jgi:hypothetical protein
MRNTETLRHPVLFCAVVALLWVSPVESEDFHGYPCTIDCSGHEAGYGWAEEHGIHDPGDCGGNSNSFIEGCEAYATEHSDASEGSTPEMQNDEPVDESAQPGEGDGPTDESAQPSESYEPPQMENPEPESSEPPPDRGE